MNLYFQDEINEILKALKHEKINLKTYENKEIVLVFDEPSFCSYMARILASVGEKCSVICSSELSDESFPLGGIKTYKNFEDFTKNKTQISSAFYFYFTNLNLYQNETEFKAKEKDLENWVKYASENENKFILCEQFDFNKPHEENICALAENELLSQSKKDETFTRGKLMLSLENTLKQNFKQAETASLILRHNAVFAPCVKTKTKLDINQIIEDFIKTNELTFNADDSATHYGAIYVSDLIIAILTLAQKGEFGSSYNLNSHSFTIHELKSILLETFADKNIKVNCNFNAENSQNSYEVLSCKKAEHLGIKPNIKFSTAIKKTASYLMDIDYQGEFFVDVYEGKLEKIKALEMNIVDEILRICKENELEVFLVGGSFLGAVRHGGFIPWDDDIDLGMMREDYDKFRKICAENLPESMFFQCNKTDENSHYIFDKIRLNGTVFATDSSINFPKMHNGIFVDILVFDKTSNNSKMQKLHIFFVRIFKLILNMIWLDEAKKQNRKTLSKIALPFLKILPFKFYHWCFDKVLCVYKNKKNSKFVIDGVGNNMLKGALPIEWLQELKETNFEGRKIKISAHEKPYLTKLYGENYMDLLPYTQRFSGHNIVQLDLGEYI
ncbi:MAG: LicD family protein [Clostridia bacterium]